jgi:hypothetical protein
LTKARRHKALFLLLILGLFLGNESKAQNIPKVGQIYTLEIANWNLEWFGKTASGFGPSDDAKQQALILKTIQNAELDVWGLCEVSEKKAFDSMMLKLPNYQAVLAPYFPEQKTALIFNTNLFSLMDSKLLGTENKDSFSTLRFPLEIRLIPKNDIGIDTLRLIVLHLKANTGTDSAKMLAYNSRKRSAEWLKMYLNKLPQNNYTMVLGDWNDDIDLSIFNNLPSPFVRLQDQGFRYQFLSKKFSDNGQGTTTNYPDAIDHQMASAALTSKHKTDSTFIWRIEQYISNYSTTCSDHYPVYSIFNTYRQNIYSSKNIARACLYPNPANNTISIENQIQNSHVIIYNSIGQVVMELKENRTNNIDMTGLPKGVYFVKIASTLHREILEFIVE